MSDLTRCSSGRRVLLKNTPPGLARDNFSTAGLVSSGHPLPGEVAFFQDAQDAIDYVRTHDAIQRIRDLHRCMPIYDTPISDCGHDMETYGIELDDGEIYCSKHVAHYVCEHCWNLDENGNADTGYPCPTIRALDGADQ